jgi:hypothetical protein
MARAESSRTTLLLSSNAPTTNASHAIVSGESSERVICGAIERSVYSVIRATEHFAKTSRANP